jgi:hypothetical protein
MLVRLSSGNGTLQKCLKNAEKMRWVFAWRGYMTQQLLSVQKHFSLRVTVPTPNVLVTYVAQKSIYPDAGYPDRRGPSGTYVENSTEVTT